MNEVNLRIEFFVGVYELCLAQRQMSTLDYIFPVNSSNAHTLGLELVDGLVSLLVHYFVELRKHLPLSGCFDLQLEQLDQPRGRSSVDEQGQKHDSTGVEHDQVAHVVLDVPLSHNESQAQ